MSHDSPQGGQTGRSGQERSEGEGLLRPIPDSPGFVASLLAKGYTLNPCRDCCQDKGTEHVHLKAPDGHDGIIWADGRVSEYDLTQPARLIYPAPRRRGTAPQTAVPGGCYRTPGGASVHVKPGCRC